MEFKLLEPITYSKNSSNPQFTPFNFVLDSNRNFLSNEEKALFISELPVIFKKYGIPLFPEDLFLWLNSYDNVADVFEIEEIIHNKQPTKEEQKEIDFLNDVLNVYKKIARVVNAQDKMLEELIHKRYGYYYNRYDQKAYEKFLIFLSSNIKDGTIPFADISLDQDFTPTKKELIEQDIRDYFYSIKNYFQDLPVVFLSKRWELVYKALVKKYPEIAFSQYYSPEEYECLNTRMNAIFLNDLNCELLPKMKAKNYVPRLNLKREVYEQLPKALMSRDPYNSQLSEREQRKIENAYKMMKYSTYNDIVEIINYLEAEREILLADGIDSTFELLPEPLREYFIFCSENLSLISYFKSEVKRLNDLNKDTNTKKNALKNMLNTFDVSIIPEEIIEIFSSKKSDIILRQEIIVGDACKEKNRFYHN